MGAPSQGENLYRKGKVWGVRLKLPTCYPKSEYKRLIGSKTQATAERDRVKTLIRQRLPLEAGADADAQTLEDFMTEAARAWPGKDKRHYYVRRWKKWAGKAPIGSITRPRLLEALRTMEEAGYASGTIRLAASVLRAAFALALEQNKIQANPWHKIRLAQGAKRKKYLTPKQLSSLIAVMGENGVMAEFAVLTGLRCNELLGLTWESIDEATLTLTLTKTKQKKEHVLGLGSRVLEILRQQRGKHAEFVFPAPWGRRWLYDAFRKYWKAWYKEAGLTGLRWHDLRHTAASFAISAGANLATIQAFLGHSSSQQTERYAHLLPGAVPITEVVSGFYQQQAAGC